MSVNLTVTGSSFQEVKEQLRGLIGELNELEGKCTEDVPVGTTSYTVKPAQDLPVPRFNITPEVASVPMAHVAAPITPAPISTNTQSQSGNVDSRGLPWDERIHSGNKEKGKDGVWRRRRGVSPEVEAQVEAELRGQAPAKKVAPFGSMTPEQYQQAVTPAPVAAPVPMPTTEHRVSLPVGPDVLSAAQIPATPAPSFAPPAMQVMPPNTFTPESFRNNLMNVLNDLAAAGKINHEWINAQKVQFGGKDVTQWYENAEACNSLFEAFVGWGLVNKL